MKCEQCKKEVKKGSVGAALCTACIKCELCGTQISWQRQHAARLCDICVQLNVVGRTHGAARVQELVRRALAPQPQPIPQYDRPQYPHDSSPSSVESPQLMRHHSYSQQPPSYGFAPTRPFSGEQKLTPPSGQTVYISAPRQ